MLRLQSEENSLGPRKVPTVVSSSSYLFCAGDETKGESGTILDLAHCKRSRLFAYLYGREKVEKMEFWLPTLRRLQHKRFYLM